MTRSESWDTHEQWRQKRQKLPKTFEDLCRFHEKPLSGGFLFLLGAGASVEAGLPTSKELVGKLTSKLKGAERHLCTRVITRLKDFNKQDPNIEELMQCLEALGNPNADSLFPIGLSWHFPIRDPRFNAEASALRERVWQLAIPLLKPTKSVEYLQHLSDFSSRKKKRSRVKTSITNVFTLNYDLTVEKACHPCRTGFDNDSSAIIYKDFNPSSFGRPGVNLYKLHGSVNWRIRKNNGDCDSGIVAIDNQRFGRFKHTARGISANVSWLPKKWPYYSLHVGPLKAMIFGERDKLTPYQPYLYLQDKFNNELSLAKVLITIGYSWSDEYINSRIELVTPTRTAPGVLVTDITWKQAADAFKEPKRRVPHIIIGGGTKNALQGNEVSVAVRLSTGGPPLLFSCDGGVVGALREISRRGYYSSLLESVLAECYRKR